MKALHAFGRGFWRLTLAFAAVAAGGWTAWPGEPGATDPSTREMARLLAELASRVDPRRMPFQVDDRRADLLAEDLTRPRPTLERLQLRFSYASTLLRAGRTADSLTAIDALEKDAITNAPDQWAIDRSLVETLRAMAYLRLAEEQNCHQPTPTTRACSPSAARASTGSARARARHRGAGGLLEGPRRPAGALAPERRPHDAGQLPGRRPARVSSRPALRRRSTRCRASRTWPSRPGSTSTAWRAAPSWTTSTATAASTSVSHSGFEDQTRFFRNSGDGTFEDRTEAPASPARWAAST